MVNVTATLNSRAATYIAAATYIGLATGAPGATTTPANEATGGSPAYARVATTWGSVSAGGATGSAVTINVAAATYTNMILASAAALASANMVDNCALASNVVMGAQGTIVVTPTWQES